jgi:hypothetical protein
MLHDHGARQNCLALGEVQNTQAYQVTATQLAVYSEIEQHQIADLFGDLEPYSDRSDLFELQRRLLANEPAFVPRHRRLGIFNMEVHESLLQ